MSYDIDRAIIYRSELTIEEIKAVAGLEGMLYPCVEEIIWQSTGDFVLSHTERGKKNSFYLNQEMLKAINDENNRTR